MGVAAMGVVAMGVVAGKKSPKLALQ